MSGNQKLLYNVVLSAIFLALALVLPFLNLQIPEISSILCLMHIPVILCGFICGWPYGLIVGFTAPLLRSLVFGMPLLFPTALSMSFELATYGFVSAMFYKLFPKKIGFIYLSLVIAMLIGRAVWGISMFACFGFNYHKFGISAFLTGAFVNAIPGIILQIVLIPGLIIIYDKIKDKSKGDQNGKRK